MCLVKCIAYVVRSSLLCKCHDTLYVIEADIRSCHACLSKREIVFCYKSVTRDWTKALHVKSGRKSITNISNIWRARHNTFCLLFPKSVNNELIALCEINYYNKVSRIQVVIDVSSINFLCARVR